MESNNNDNSIKKFKDIFLTTFIHDSGFRRDICQILKYDEDFADAVGEAYENYQMKCARAEASAWT